MTLEKFKQIQYYAIVGVISLIALFFLPMLGSSKGLEWNTPDTLTGWVVYIISKLIVAVINILIFHCFVLQGKQNIQSNPKFLEAQKLLLLNNSKKAEKPKSPKEWNHNIYGKKGITLFLTSSLSAIGLTQGILVFDWVSMLTYLFTIIMGIIFGILQMNATEVYWTEEFWQYAHYITELEKEKVDDNN